MTDEEVSVIQQSAIAEDNRDKQRASCKKWYKKNIVSERKRKLGYYEKNKKDPEYLAKRKQYSTEYRQRPGVKEARAKQHREWCQRPEYKEYIKWRNIDKKYGLTPEMFNDILISQGGSCAACGRTNWNKLGPTVDHDHNTGKIRAILCSNCNNAAGNLGDSSDRAKKLYNYLKKHGV